MLTLVLLSLFVVNDVFLASAEPKIVNGIPTTPASYPYIVSIRENGGLHFCGGSFITNPSGNNPIVLTAAHCLADNPNPCK